MLVFFSLLCTSIWVYLLTPTYVFLDTCLRVNARTYVWLCLPFCISSISSIYMFILPLNSLSFLFVVLPILLNVSFFTISVLYTSSLFFIMYSSRHLLLFLNLLLKGQHQNVCKDWRWLDPNPSPLLSETTILSTEPLTMSSLFGTYPLSHSYKLTQTLMDVTYLILSHEPLVVAVHSPL